MALFVDLALCHLLCIVILGSKLVSSRTGFPLEPDAIYSVLPTYGLIVLQHRACGGGLRLPMALFPCT